MSPAARRLLPLILASLACSVLGGFLPGPTHKPVTPADIAGVYTYDVGDQTVSITFNADGTFDLTRPGEVTRFGTWALDGAKLSLEFNANGVTPAEGIGGWYVYDTDDGGFAIMGGEESDPDDWPGLIRVRGSQPPG